MAPCRSIDVLDGLNRWSSKSLLRQEARADGEPWYAMLETVREYALERLEESGEAGEVHRRSRPRRPAARRGSEPRLAGPEQAIWFARLEQEHDNLRSALRWSQEQGYARPALRLAAALWWFWSAHGHVQEGRERVTSLLARFPLKVQPDENPRRAELHAKMLWVAGMLASMQGDHAVSRALQEESLGLRRLMGDPYAIFNSLEGLGTITCFERDYVAAGRYLEEALAMARGLRRPDLVRHGTARAGQPPQRAR